MRVLLAGATGRPIVERLQRLASTALGGTALRYGFVWGPGTWYHQDGSMADAVRARRVPLIGDGSGVYDFVHVEDAAHATVAALEAEPGIYNIVDDRPTPQAEWLPPFARWVGAEPPSRLREQEAQATVGPDAGYYATRLRGASNAKAKRVLGFRPRLAAWMDNQ